MIANDEPVQRQCMKYALKSLGVKQQNIIVKEDGKEAVDYICRDHHYVDIVLMDLNMPNLNGMDATKAIREHFR